MSKVRALKDRATIQKVTWHLNKHYPEQYGQIWRFGINVGLRAGDIVALPMRTAWLGHSKGYIEVKEQKTGNIRSLPLNAEAGAVIRERLNAFPDDEWLFQSHGNRGKSLSQALSTKAIYDVLRAVGEEVGVKMGTHTMRKTRGRMLHEAGESIEKIAEVLGHKNTQITRTYIDITQDEVDKTFLDLVL